MTLKQNKNLFKCFQDAKIAQDMTKYSLKYFKTY